MNLLKKFFTFSYGSWIGFFIGIFATMVSTRILSPDNFGRYSMFNTAINIIMLLIIFGTDQSFVRFFYEEDEEKRGGLLYNCIKFPLYIAIIVNVLIIIFYKKVSNYIVGEENFHITIVLAISVVLNAVYRYSTLVIRMQQRGNLYSILSILIRALDFIFIIIFYYFYGNRYEVLVYASVIAYCLLSIISIFVEKEYWKLSNYSLDNLKHSKSEILKYAYPLVLTSMISWLFTSFDKIALKYWSTYAEIGIYSSAAKLASLLIILQSTFTTFWTPVCYEHYEKFPEDRKFYEVISKIITISMFTVAILSVACKDIIVLLLGDKYHEAANIMPFLIFMPIMYTISETTVIGINFNKKPKWHVLISSIACATNILGNAFLVPKFGAKGAAVSTAFSYITFFILRTHISLKYYKVDYGLGKIYMMLIVISIYAIYATFWSNSIINIIIGTFIIFFLYAVYFKDIKDIYEKHIKGFIYYYKKRFN